MAASRKLRINIPGPYLITLILVVALFLLVDVFRINNYSGGFLFLTVGNLLNVLSQVTLYAIIGFGMTLVIIVTGIDLSVGSIMALAGVVVSMLIVNAGVPLLGAIAAIIVMGLAIGAMHGFLIERFGIPAFVVTLGSMIFFRGMALILVDGSPVFNDNPAFLFIGNGSLLGMPFPIFILIAFFIAFQYLLRFTQFGKFTYAIGGNEEAARLSGINMYRMKITIYALCTMTATVSGLIVASRLGSGQPLAGTTWELYVITTVIIGGASLSGGVGLITWTIAGAIIYGLINNGMNLLNIVPYYQWVIRGAVILVAVAIKESSVRRGAHQHRILVE